jgi:hypothetical protein
MIDDISTNLELDIRPCGYTLMTYETPVPAPMYTSVKELIAIVRHYMDEFFGRSTTPRQIDVYVNHIYVNHFVCIKFRDEEMYTMFKLGHG